ncbi:YHS domain-containing (seleno)protein [Flaviaesturariibacter amylovorans]|uniref:YHS domain-containing (Seleno)protein n=1 Tax=Flaviaesturariibacter amylovorans TaxID=1084520 RepID=A0ABP8H7J8_9BACT
MVALFLLFSVSAVAQPEVRRAHYNLSKSSLAISGYDPVAYFSQNKAVEGRKDISVVHEGLLYHFATEANRVAFRSAPSKYEPQYGGWCAYAMGAKGEQVDVDPETFKVVNGKLFLFYNRFFNNTLKSWNKNEQHLHANADANWDKLLRQWSRPR